MPPKSAAEVALAALTPPALPEAEPAGVEELGGEQAATPRAARAARDATAYLMGVLLT